MGTVFNYLGAAGAYESLSPVGATAFSENIRKPTAGTYANMTALAALITIETNAIRFREDGSNPSATEGLRIEAGQNYTVVGSENVERFRVIDTADGASTVKVQMYF